MHQGHAEALQHPDHIEKRGEGELPVGGPGGDAVGGPHEAHDDQARKGDHKAGGDGPFPAYLFGDGAGDGKADHRGETAQNGQDHGGAGDGFQIVDDVVADVGAEGIVAHEPEELRPQDSQEHVPVGLGHGLVVVDGGLYGGKLLTQGQLILQLLSQLVFLDGLEEHQGGDHHQHRGDDEGQLDGPDVPVLGPGVDVVGEHHEDAQDCGEGAAEVAHDVDDAVGLGPQGLGGDVRHQGHGGIAVHHHEDQHDHHGDDHAHDVVAVEEQGDEGEGHRGNEGAHQNIGHALADGGLRLIREVAEDGQQDQGGQVVAGHDDAHDPLHVQDLIRIAGFQLGRGHAVNVVGEDIRQKRGAPGVVHLPEQQDAEEGKADEGRAPDVELQAAVDRALRRLFLEHVDHPFPIGSEELR